MAVSAMGKLAFELRACGACGFLWSTGFDIERSAGSRVATQILQIRPAVLFIVGQSTWNVLHGSLGAHVRRDPPISARPADRDFTLLRETTALKHPAYLELDAMVDGRRARHRARLVITPGVSDARSFPPQFHLSPTDWRKLQHEQPTCVALMTPARGVALLPPGDPDDHMVLQLSAEPAKARAAIAMLKEFPAAWHVLAAGYYDPHAMMVSVLDDMYERGQLSWSDRSDAAGYLAHGAATA